MNEDCIYIIGHKKPDLDSVVSAYAYQHYKNAKKGLKYLAAVCEDVNNLTKWVFYHFNQDIPQKIDSIANKKVILVDHSESQQRPFGWENAKIVEIIDHHKLNLKDVFAPKITIEPYGSTATIIAQKYLQNEAPLSPELAGILLSAILDDTLALKSPITTVTDEIMVAEMAAKSKIGDITAFTRELFNKKDSWSSMSAVKIVETDMKESFINNISIVVSQVETMDNKELEKREDEFIAALHFLQKQKPVDLRLLMLTDLLSNTCIMLGIGEKIEDLEKIFNTKLIKNRKIYLPEVLSRKQQITLPILNYYSK